MRQYGGKHISRKLIYPNFLSVPLIFLVFLSPFGYSGACSLSFARLNWEPRTIFSLVLSIRYSNNNLKAIFGDTCYWKVSRSRDAEMISLHTSNQRVWYCTQDLIQSWEKFKTSYSIHVFMWSSPTLPCSTSQLELNDFTLQHETYQNSTPHEFLNTRLQKVFD